MNDFEEDRMGDVQTTDQGFEATKTTFYALAIQLTEKDVARMEAVAQARRDDGDVVTAEVVLAVGDQRREMTFAELRRLLA